MFFRFPRLMAALLALVSSAFAADTAPVDVEPQPFLTALGTLIESTDYLGSPFSPEDKTALRRAMDAHDSAAAQRILDTYTIFVVNITPEQRVKVEQGAAKAVLDEGGWHQYLVKVINEAGVTAKLAAHSPQANQVFVAAPTKAPSPQHALPALADRWLDLQMFEDPPARPALSGLNVEYRIIQLYSRDAGKREAIFAFDAGQGTQDLGFRNEVSVLFDCRPARDIRLSIVDETGAPCMGELLIKDSSGRIYPSPAKRIAPDFFFHPQIYRGDGESLRLPDGEYEIDFERGPESLSEHRRVQVTSDTHELHFQVRRWIDPSKLGWWSGDHHIHAAGCKHYFAPSMGVLPADMARHCQGEDLKVGANLTWGPCFDYQKQFFTGTEDQASRYPFLLRYDIEVSGFGSHKSGHLCLLKLRDQIYPGGDSTAHWPTLCLNTLKWAKKQGALCGPAHSGWGLQPMADDDPVRSSTVFNPLATRSVTDDLPNYIIPPFNGVGANEYIADVTHEVEGPQGKPVPAVDFLSMVDTPHTWELNIWYHTLNAGFRTRISGETDFPCIYGERVGLGRSYVKLDGNLSYDDWCEGIRAGRCYVSDGRSHLMEFKANDVSLGQQGSELRLSKPASIHLTAQVAAILDEKPHPEIHSAAVAEKPYWNIERARIGGTRTVPVEVIVNGESVLQKTIVADGATREIEFDVPIERSCWIALRIRASSHTNPIFVIVGDKPIRVKRSIEWCLNCVDQCWSQKEKFIDPREHEDAVAAYEHAREVYRARLGED